MSKNEALFLSLVPFVLAMAMIYAFWLAYSPEKPPILVPLELLQPEVNFGWPRQIDPSEPIVGFNWDYLEKSPCDLYQSYSDSKQFIVGIVEPAVKERLENLSKEVGKGTFLVIYSIMERGEHLDCSGYNSSIIEEVSVDFFSPDKHDRKVIRRGYLTAVRSEIKHDIEKFKEDKNDNIKEWLALLIGHALNKWHFSLRELGVSQEVYDEIFLK